MDLFCYAICWYKYIGVTDPMCAPLSLFKDKPHMWDAEMFLYVIIAYLGESCFFCRALYKSQQTNIIQPQLLLLDLVKC